MTGPHTVIVITKRKDGNILQVRNLSTKTSFDSSELAPLQIGPSGFVWSTIGMAGLLAIPAFIAWLSVAIGVREALFGGDGAGAIDIGWHFRAFVVLLLGACAWLTVRMSTGRQSKAKRLAANIDVALAEIE